MIDLRLFLALAVLLYIVLRALFPEGEGLSEFS
jgi:hypothetical protein